MILAWNNKALNNHAAIAIVLFAIVQAAAMLDAKTAFAESGDRPNIIFIMADDKCDNIPR